MDQYESEIFSRAYQSYLMGGDLHIVNFNKRPEVNKKNEAATDSLQKKGLIEITFKSEKRVKFYLTDKGIEYGSLQY